MNKTCNRRWYFVWILIFEAWVVIVRASRYPVQMSLLSVGYAKLNMCDMAFLHDRIYTTIALTFEYILEENGNGCGNII